MEGVLQLLLMYVLCIWHLYVYIYTLIDPDRLFGKPRGVREFFRTYSSGLACYHSKCFVSRSFVGVL